MIFRQPRLPGQLPKALQEFKAQFIHGGLGVEEYLKREPYLEWTSAFVTKVCHALQQMMRHFSQVNHKDDLVIYPLHSPHQRQH